jgi:hypothetical protein
LDEKGGKGGDLRKKRFSRKTLDLRNHRKLRKKDKSGRAKQRAG